MYVSNERHSRQELEVICLAIGMAIHELMGLNELEPDEPLPHDVPDYWATSVADFSLLQSTLEPAAQRMIAGLQAESFNTPLNERMRTRKKAAEEQATELEARRVRFILHGIIGMTGVVPRIQTRSKAMPNAPPGKTTGKPAGGRR